MDRIQLWLFGKLWLYRWKANIWRQFADLFLGSIVISAVCQGLLFCRRHIGKREDPGDEVGKHREPFGRHIEWRKQPFPSPTRIWQIFGVLTFTRNGRREFVPRDQVFPLLSVYSLLPLQISSLMLVLTIGIVRDCFYLLIFCSGKFSTWVWRLPLAVNAHVNLNLWNLSSDLVRPEGVKQGWFAELFA